jgi:hypothetical protein
VAGKTFRTFEYEGVKYLLSQPLRMASYSDEEALVLWKRRDPGEFALRMVQRLPASYHAGIWEGAAAANMRGIPSEEEWSAYNGSSWKTAYMLWHTLDSKHKVDKDTSGPIDLIDGVQWALGFITSLPREKLQELSILIALVSQDTAIKNSSGRTAQPAPAESQPPDDLATTDIRQSTNFSETDTDSDQTK